MAWVPTPAYDFNRRFRFDGGHTEVIPNPHYDRREDKGRFNTAYVTFLFINDGEQIPLLVYQEQWRQFFLGVTAFEGLMADPGRIPKHWREHPRLGFCGTNLVIRTKGAEADDYGALVLVRTQNGWKRGYQKYSDPIWSQTPILLVPFL